MYGKSITYYIAMAILLLFIQQCSKDNAPPNDPVAIHNDTEAQSKKDFGKIVDFIREAEKDAIQYLNERHFRADISVANNIQNDSFLRSAVPPGSMVIATDDFQIIEDISNEGFLRKDLTRTTHYAKSVKAEDINNKDTHHVQTDHAIIYIRTDYKANLAGPNSTNRKNYPQWSFEKSNVAIPYLYNSDSVAYWLYLPYSTSTPYSILDMLGDQRDKSFSFTADEHITTISIHHNNRQLFQGEFLNQQSGRWKSLAYFDENGYIRSILLATQVDNKQIKSIFIYRFSPGQTNLQQIDEARLNEAGVISKITIREDQKQTYEPDYFDAYKHIESHHTVFDKIKDEYYEGGKHEVKMALTDFMKSLQ